MYVYGGVWSLCMVVVVYGLCIYGVCIYGGIWWCMLIVYGGGGIWCMYMVVYGGVWTPAQFIMLVPSPLALVVLSLLQLPLPSLRLIPIMVP